MAMAFQPPPYELAVHKQPSLDEGGAPHPGRPEHLFSLSSTASAGPTGRVKCKPVTLVVFTMKQGENLQMKFDSGRFTTVAQITEIALKELRIAGENASTFSLWLTSKHLQLQLKSYHLPCKLFKRWKDLLSQYTRASYEDICEDEPILSFQRNAFFPVKEERKLLDPRRDCRKIIDLLYHEAVFNVTRMRYPISREELHTLAGLQAAVYAGETGTGESNPAELRHLTYRFYPKFMLGSEKKALGKLFKTKAAPVEKTLEVQFTEAFSSARRRTTDPHQLKILYLQLCWSKPFYGSVMFRGQIERHFNPARLLSDKRVTVAINTECLHIFEATTPPDIMLYLTYDQLSWEFEPVQEEGEDFYSSLWLEFDSTLTTTTGENQRVCKRVQIFSRQAPMMDAMISRCVADIDAREEELRRKRLEQGGNEILPEVSIKTYHQNESPRVQRQEKNYKEHKLRCTTYSTEGELLDAGGFTLTRALKKRSRAKQVPRTSASEAIDSPGNTPSDADTQLQSFGHQRSGTQDSHSSTDL